ncbi:MAG: AbrB/MazE/SpoVT family DNA-binding domain-containing protein [Dehalococcoidia bacterium]|nr:AbrB/MazE/SpoVT family DNA-binding domain-containing protein [Dehalococcoidia bacterium]
MQEFAASVTERGQVTIPAEVRKLLGIQKRGKVSFVVEDGQVVLRKPRFTTVESVYGSVKALDKPLDWKEVERIAHEEVAEYHMSKMRRK